MEEGRCSTEYRSMCDWRFNVAEGLLTESKESQTMRVAVSARVEARCNEWQLAGEITLLLRTRCNCRGGRGCWWTDDQEWV